MKKRILLAINMCIKVNNYTRMNIPKFKTIVSLTLFCTHAVQIAAQQPLDYVNMLIGTAGKHSTEYGGTTPAVSEPFGMTQWCAVTRINGISKTMYHHSDTKLSGFMATHQPAIWMGDYGFFTLMPQEGELKISADDRAVNMDRKGETATPYYYKISQKSPSNHTITTELTATSRCSVFKFHYSGKDKAILFLEAGREKEGGSIQIIPEKQEIRLYNKERHDTHLGPPLANFKGYYVLKFSKPFSAYGTWNKEIVTANQKNDCGSNIGGYIEFEPDTDVVELRTGSSFISYEQAEINMRHEVPVTESFEQIKERVKGIWARKLNKIAIKKASKDDLTVFYTAFFRTLQYPREFSEYGNYYSPFDDQIHAGVSYTAYSLWDTFRAQHPWLLLTSPDRVNDMITSLIQMYREGGWIPKWANPTYTNIMIGTHADAVIADAYVNGYRNYDLQEAYKAIRKNAFVPPLNDENYRWGDRNLWNGGYEARGGLTNYMKSGYVASDKTDESVARTLEFAMDDYCVAQMAKGLGYKDDYEVLMQRSTNYRNLYNPETGFFQARKSDGSWDNANAGFTEGANWTYRFCVMQDVPGMIALTGGDEPFIKVLDENFDNGHYRHDNEPGHHYAYLYNQCGRLDKTQSRIPAIINENYKNSPDGLSGNDDCGQMSAWYLFSCLGFYPLTPASGEYTLGIPHFEEVTVELPNNKKLTVTARNLKKNKLLTKVKFNGKLLDKPYIPVKAILEGGKLEFLSN